MSKLIDTSKPVKPSLTRDRFFRVEDKWYFAVRRGPDQGPFASRNEASVALQQFLSRVKDRPDNRRFSQAAADDTSVFIS